MTVVQELRDSLRLLSALTRLPGGDRLFRSIEVHGEAYEYDPEVGPTIDLAVHFQACVRD